MASKGKADEKKDESLVGKLRVEYNELNEEVQQIIVEAAEESLTDLLSGVLHYYQDVAGKIKTSIEEKCGGSWHIVVGKNFGSFVTHQTRSIIYFFLGEVGFLIFRHG
ncbi:unnamed protein product [Heterosigma akashiwo]